MLFHLRDHQRLALVRLRSVKFVPGRVVFGVRIGGGLSLQECCRTRRRLFAHELLAVLGVATKRNVIGGQIAAAVGTHALGVSGSGMRAKILRVTRVADERRVGRSVRRRAGALRNARHKRPPLEVVGVIRAAGETCGFRSTRRRSRRLDLGERFSVKRAGRRGGELHFAGGFAVAVVVASVRLLGRPANVVAALRGVRLERRVATVTAAFRFTTYGLGRDFRDVVVPVVGSGVKFRRVLLVFGERLRRCRVQRMFHVVFAVSGAGVKSARGVGALFGFHRGAYGGRRVFSVVVGVIRAAAKRFVLRWTVTIAFQRRLRLQRPFAVVVRVVRTAVEIAGRRSTIRGRFAGVGTSIQRFAVERGFVGGVPVVGANGLAVSLGGAYQRTRNSLPRLKVLALRCGIGERRVGFVSAIIWLK